MRKADEAEQQLNNQEEEVPLPQHRQHKFDFVRKTFSKIGDDFANYITAISTAALVVYTIVLSEYAAKQTKIQSDQLERVDRALAQTEILIKYSNAQTKSANIQAQSSVSQSQSATQLNNQSAAFTKVQLRAFLVLQELIDFDSDGVPAGFKMKNVGATPATDITIFSRITISRRELIEKLLANGVDREFNLNGKRVMGAGIESNEELAQYEINQSATDVVSFTFDANLRNDLRNGRKMEWISGVIYYRDIFGDGHSTRFCMTRQAPTYYNRWCGINNELN